MNLSGKSKKIVSGLLGLLFIVTIVQSAAIIKISDRVSTQQSAVVYEYNSLSKKKEFRLSTSLENTIKIKYPKDYQKRITEIEKYVNEFLAESGFQVGQKSIFTRILCWLMGGQYYQEVGPSSYCARIDAGLTGPDTDVGILSDTATQKSVSTALPNPINTYFLAEKNSEISRINPSYNADMIALFQELKIKLASQGVDVDDELWKSWWQRFLCELFGGNYSESVIDVPGAPPGTVAYVRACNWENS